MNTEELLKEIERGKQEIKKMRLGQDIRWPLQFKEVDPLFVDIYFKELKDDIKEILKKEKIDYLKNFFNYPSQIWEMLIHGIPVLKGLNIPNKEIDDYSNSFLDLLKIIKKNDIFDYDKNVVLSDKEVLKYLDKLISPKNNDQEKLIALVSSYIYAIYSHWDCFANEFHGPYKTDKGIIIIRDFFNLRPIELFKETKKFPFDKIRIITLYNNIDIKLDLFNHIITDKNLPDELVSYAIICDGKSVDEIENLIDITKELTIDITKKWDNVSDKEKKITYIRSMYYDLKPLRDSLSKNWQPNEEVLNRIK